MHGLESMHIGTAWSSPYSMQDHSSELLAARVILYTHINYINYSTLFLFLGNNRV